MVLAILGANHKVGNSTKETGTAVMTIKDCKAEIPPEPIEIKAMATTPIKIPQKARILPLGWVDPVTTTLMV